MKTLDLFKINRTSKRINESLQKTFGKKINLENFDLHQLQDARNKLRTQLSQIRSDSGFNEAIESDAYFEAQWMLDAINSEIAQREEFAVDATVDEGRMAEVDQIMQDIASGRADAYDVMNHPKTPEEQAASKILQDMYDNISIDHRLHPDDDFEQILDILADQLADEYGTDEGIETEADEPGTMKVPGGQPDLKRAYTIDIATLPKYGKVYWVNDHGANMIITKKPDGAIVVHKLGDHKQIAAIWQKIKAKKTEAYESVLKNVQCIIESVSTGWETRRKPVNESISGDNMRRTLREGEVQQASAIVTAKTMADRVGRWIEELSGMENDTLLQLGDSIRDEMSQEMAKQFIEQVAPAIQQALEHLKTTRETIATGVRILTGEEQSVEMIGSEPAAEPELGGEEELGAAEPDMMNAEPELGAEDEFAAAEPAAGGLEGAGREQRESIQFQNRLLKVLAG